MIIIEEKLKANMYDTYEEAAQRAIADVAPAAAEPIKLYNVGNCVALLTSVYRLSLVIYSPYVVIPLLLILSSVNFSSVIGEGCILLLVCWLLSFYGPNDLSPITGKRGPYPYGGSVCPTLQYQKSDSSLCAVLDMCPLITSKAVLTGSLPKLSSTPWIFNGDLRTLLPFLTNAPPDVEYQRQWVRVPVSAGSIKVSGKYEAVALDWARAKKEGTSSDGTIPAGTSTSKTVRPKVAVLVLAGLTGGSKEGYVLDLVNAFTARGWECFVMVARGLANTPLESGVLFNGARTDDVVAAAKAIRCSLCTADDVVGEKENSNGHKHDENRRAAKLFVVGVSLGAIIASNALIKNTLGDYVDGVVAVSGVYNISGNAPFRHSRLTWQPLLAHGLKESFAVPARYLAVLRRLFGVRAQAVVDNVQDVVDFDSIMVTNMHNYDSVEEYYSDMHIDATTLQDVKKHPGIVLADGGSNSRRIKRPLLVLNAIDDPIAHADTLPASTTASTASTTADGTTSNLVATEVGNMVCLVTAAGGHVGWPLGLLPWQSGFLFMSSIAAEFCQAIANQPQES